MAEFTEGPHTGEHLISEAQGSRSRETVTFAASQDIAPGEIVAQVTTGALTAVGAAVAGNAGAATITAAPAVAAGTPEGIYMVTVRSAGAAGEWEMEDPEGVSLGTSATGTPTTLGGIGPFGLTDVGADPAVGDQYTITVTAADATAQDQFKALNLAATDGTQIPVGLSYDAIVTGVGETKRGVIHDKDCEVNGHLVTYPTGATDDEKAAIRAALAERGVIVR